MSKKLFLLLILLLAFNPAFSEVTEKRTIAVSGKSNISAEPDMATVNFSIVTKDEKFREARELNAKASAAVLNAVRSIKIAEENISLKSLNINEDREYDRSKRKSVLVGYKAQRNFSVSIYKDQLKKKKTLSDKLAQLITAVAENGSNQLQGVEYGIKDTKALEEKALSAAVKDAKNKAKIMLAPLDAKVGDVQTIAESGHARPMPVTRSLSMMAAPAMTGASAVPDPDSYSESDIEVSSSVDVVFEIL